MLKSTFSGYLLHGAPPILKAQLLLTSAAAVSTQCFWKIKHLGLKSSTQKMRATCEKLYFSAATGAVLAEMIFHSCLAVTKARQNSHLFCGIYFIF